MNFRDLKLRVDALIAPRRMERELDEELASHLEHETQKHVARGLSDADARARARASFGSPALAADQCRDARGIALFDALARDIRYAFTTFRRDPLSALTIVATVALGLGLVAVVFTLYSTFFLRVDAVRNPGELFEVRRPPSPGATKVWVQMTKPQYQALQRDTTVFTDAFAMLEGGGTRIDGRAASGTFVTGNFFQVLGVNAALGRTLTPSDDERFAGRPVIVLSDRGWTKLLAGDRSAIGRKLVINGAPYEVAGVMPPGFRGLGTSPPDYWAPLALAGAFRRDFAGKEDDIAIAVVGRLKPGLSPAAAAAGLTVWASGSPDLAAVDGRPKTIILKPRQGTASTDVGEQLMVFAPVFFAFGLILMIGCANVANLLLARGVSRQREIGIRLSLGASRGRIIRQLLTESLLLALAAAAGGLAISRLVLETAIHLAVTTMPPEMAERIDFAVPAADWRVLAFLLCGAIVSTVVFGLAPALQATRLELVRTMRGELTRDARPGRARNALIGLQVGASALLLICAAVFLRSALAAAAATPGLRTADTITLGVGKEPLRAAMLQAVNTDPSVEGVAASWPQVLDHLTQGSTLAEVAADGPAGTATTLPVGYKFVSPEYFNLLDIDVVRGRGFTPSERRADAGIIVVSETIARRLWPNGDAIGQVVRLASSRQSGTRPPEADASAAGRAKGESSAAPLPFGAFTVVGVVRDVRVGLGMFEYIERGVYLPIGAESPGASLILRVHGDPDQARLRLIERLTPIDPAMDGIRTVRTLAGMAAYVLRVVFWVTAVLGGLALLLTLSGLFSVLAYVVEQRRQEIGVRMALGATTRCIAVLVLSQSARPVGYGLIAGGGLAAALAMALMSTPAAAQIGSMVHVFDPVAYAGSLIGIVTACALAASIPALRAARIDPMTTLRQD